MPEIPPETPAPDMPVIPIAKGDVIEVEPKNPFKSKTFLGLAMMVSGFFINKYAPAWLKDSLTQFALELITWLIGALGSFFIAIGRWTATRPMGFGISKTTIVKLLLLGTLILPITATQTGCAIFSPASQTQDQKKQAITALMIANDTYKTSLQIIMIAARAHLIAPKDLLRYEPYRLAVEAALDEAEKNIDTDLPAAQKALETFNAAYAKYAELREKASQPASREPSPSSGDLTPAPLPE